MVREAGSEAGGSGRTLSPDPGEAAGEWRGRGLASGEARARARARAAASETNRSKTLALRHLHSFLSGAYVKSVYLSRRPLIASLSDDDSMDSQLWGVGIRQTLGTTLEPRQALWPTEDTEPIGAADGTAGRSSLRPHASASGRRLEGPAFPAGLTPRACPVQRADYYIRAPSLAHRPQGVRPQTIILRHARCRPRQSAAVLAGLLVPHEVIPPTPTAQNRARPESKRPDSTRI